MAPKLAPRRRPAAGKAALRRPARAVEAAEREEEEETKLRNFADVDPRAVASVKALHLPDAVYYGRRIKLAGHVKGLRSEAGDWFLDLEVSGTRDEDLLRILSGKRSKVISVHLCTRDCNQQLTDELLVHGDKYEEVKLDEEGWMKNLLKVQAIPGEEDDLVELRREQERMEAAAKEDKKLSKKEKRKRKEDADEGRRGKSPRAGEDEREVGQKSLDAVFGGTGMYPSPKSRSKVLKKARKIAKREKKGKKKKEKGSSSEEGGSTSSCSSSSSLDMGDKAIFEEEKKLRAVWKRCPGALSSRSLQEIKRSLVTAAGTAWELNKQALPPLFTQYCRQVVMPGMSASLQQEVITISQSLDLMTQGKIASSMDVLTQRLKSLEALGRGAHWTMCRQYELVKTEEGGMTENQEKLSAARQAREEDRLRNLMSRPSSGKGGDFSQPMGGKTRKGKDSKGAGKNQATDAGKNRGGTGGREETKPQWQKK